MHFVSSDDAGVDGLLLVDKPGLAFGMAAAPPPTDAPPPNARAWPTSHDIVQQVRRLSRQRRIGHTGTLDPMASGLLVLCLGRATRLVEYYQGHPKAYRAEITLGYATDTYDALGSVSARMPVPNCTPANLEEALQRLRGEQMQVPPVYSALKQGGESLHYKARRGEEVTLQPRRVTFYTLDVVDFAPPARITLAIHCSAGAYVRSLAVDLGRALGTVATLTALRRTAAGPFTVDNAHTPPAIAAAAAAGALDALLLAPGVGLDLPAYAATPEIGARLGQGQTVPFEALTPQSATRAAPGAQAQVCSPAGALLGIVRLLTSSTQPAAPSGWRAEKWFA